MFLIVKWNISCILVGKNMSQLSVILALQMWMWEREHNAWDPAVADTLHSESWRAGGMQEAAICLTCHPLQWTRN